MSTTSYILYYGTPPINWSSRKQCAVAQSSIEAEYRVVASALAETNWVMNLLRKLHVSLSALPTIFCENVGATYLCHNPIFHSRMKHIAIDFHFVQEQVQQKLVDVKHVHFADQVADTLTKPLAKSAFHHHLPKLAIVDTTSNLKGRIGGRIGHVPWTAPPLDVVYIQQPATILSLQLVYSFV